MVDAPRIVDENSKPTAASDATNRDLDSSSGGGEPPSGAARAEVVHRRDSGLRNDAGSHLHSLVLNLRGGARFQQVTTVVALEASDLDLFQAGSVVPVRVIDEIDLRVEVDLDRARAERGSA
ncbi:MAG TPA: hypothetical protein PLS63_06850 [Microthrixaceae bacterium]|jgi:hypothetical protein|nr:hypothetical protein [Microthrixaceae bacterium]